MRVAVITSADARRTAEALTLIHAQASISVIIAIPGTAAQEWALANSVPWEPVGNCDLLVSDMPDGEHVLFALTNDIPVLDVDP